MDDGAAIPVTDTSTISDAVVSNSGSIPLESQRLLRLATYASVSVAAVLIVCKFGAWLVTDSVSLLSTMIDSMLDVLASLVNLIAVRHALQPADREHRFGHGKAEPLAGLAQAAFISGSAVFLVLESVERLIRPREITSTDVGLVVMVFSIVLTVALVGFQRYVVAKTGSVAIKADSLHYQTDVLVNLSVIVSLLLASKLGWTLADPIFAIGIVAYILWGAISIGRSSLRFLMDHELPDEDRSRIRDISLSHAGVIDIHDLRTRSSGQQSFIQLHLEMDGNISLFEAHEISDAVELSLQEAFPTAEVLIHEDPEGVEEHRAEFQ
jgi:ferrous-iron efflux pump FieF